MRVGAWVALLLIVGCKSHTTLQPPSSSLTAEQRIAFYNATEGDYEHILDCSNCITGNKHSIILRDGREIYFPEDLVSIVGEDTETARQADRAVSARRMKYITGGLGTASFIAGALTWFTAERDTPQRTLGIVMIAAGFAGSIISIFYRWRERSSTSDAYNAFNPELRKKLDLCVKGLGIVPCDQATPQASADTRDPIGPLSSSQPQRALH